MGMNQRNQIVSNDVSGATAGPENRRLLLEVVDNSRKRESTLVRPL